MAEQPFFMITVSDQAEANRIITALTEEGISVTKEYEDSLPADAFTESAIEEIHLLVSSQKEDRARDVLIKIGALELENDGTEKLQETQAEETGGKNFSGIWMTILVLLLVVLAVFGTDAIISFVKALLFQ